jgi:hypothetical protein
MVPTQYWSECCHAHCYRGGSIGWCLFSHFFRNKTPDNVPACIVDQNAERVQHQTKWEGYEHSFVPLQVPIRASQAFLQVGAAIKRKQRSKINAEWERAYLENESQISGVI